MATITTLAGGAGVGNTASRVPYVADVIVDFAEAATAKGSALAAADVIQAISVPANTMVLGAGIEVVTAADGAAAGIAMDLGVTGGDTDGFVDGFAYHSAAVGAYASVGAGTSVMVSTADTIDLLFQAATTAPVSGKVRVFAILAPVDGRGVADEVARDQLA